MNQLTLIASLPMGSGYLSSLPPEKHEQPVKVQMKAKYFEDMQQEDSLSYWTRASRQITWPVIVFMGEEPEC